MVHFLINIIHELVRDNLQEIEIIMGWVLRFEFEILINFMIFLKHVEYCVFAMIKTSKSVNDYILLAFITKRNFIDSMVHLHHKSFTFRSVEIRF